MFICLLGTFVSCALLISLFVIQKYSTCTNGLMKCRDKVDCKLGKNFNYVSLTDFATNYEINKIHRNIF